VSPPQPTTTWNHFDGGDAVKAVSKFISDAFSHIKHPAYYKLIASGVVILLVVAFFEVFTIGNFNYFDAFANLLVICGALLVASGAVISRDMRNRIGVVMDEQETHPEIPLTERNMLILKLELMKAMHDRYTPLGPIEAQAQQDEIQDILTKIKSVGKPSSRLSQFDIANVIREASDNSEAGTILIVIGTLILILVKLTHVG
jgi:hypothetical protein